MIYVLKNDLNYEILSWKIIIIMNDLSHDLNHENAKFKNFVFTSVRWLHTFYIVHPFECIID